MKTLGPLNSLTPVPLVALDLRWATPILPQLRFCGISVFRRLPMTDFGTLKKPCWAVFANFGTIFDRLGAQNYKRRPGCKTVIAFMISIFPMVYPFNIVLS